MIGFGPRRRTRWTRKRPRPSSTTTITLDDWRIIRRALATYIQHHAARNSWSAAEAAQRVQDKIADQRLADL